MNIGDISTRNAASRPREAAFTCGGVTSTWHDSDTDVRDTIGQLAALDPGQRVLLLGHNCHRYWEAHFACARAGLIAVPVNHRLLAAEVLDIVRDAGATGAILDMSVGASQGVLDSADFDVVVTYERCSASVNADGRRTSGGSTPVTATPGRDVARHHPINVIGFTSGTTGRTKGAVLPHSASCRSALWLSTLMGLTERSSFLACMPAYVYRGGAGGMAPALVGARTVVMDFDAGDVLAAICRERVTHAMFAPIMVERLVAHPDFSVVDLSSLQGVWIGGAPSSPSVLRALAVELGDAVDVGSLYGMTEAPCIASARWSFDGSADGGAPLSSVGRVSPLYDFRLLDESGAPVEQGVAGEIVVRGDCTMQGYWRRPDAGHDDADVDGVATDSWFATGDIATVDERGYLTIVDRRADVINSGGVNVYTAEVERIISDHPDVVRCAVVGAPDDAWGETVCAFVEITSNASRDEEAVTRSLVVWCRERLAGYKQPRTIVIETELPITSGNKLDKRALRDRMWAGRERTISG